MGVNEDAAAGAEGAPATEETESPQQNGPASYSTDMTVAPVKEIGTTRTETENTLSATSR